MITCWRPSLRQHFGLPHRAAGKMTSCKKFLLPEGVLHTRVRRAHAPTSPRSSLPQRKRAPHNRSRRPSMNLDFLFPCGTCPPEADHMSSPGKLGADIQEFLCFHKKKGTAGEPGGNPPLPASGDRFLNGFEESVISGQRSIRIFGKRFMESEMTSILVQGTRPEQGKTNKLLENLEFYY